MTDAATRQSSLPHAVFLRRLAGTSVPSAADARLSQGAFLALRLVDLLEHREPVYADGFHYQHAATERFCRELPAACTETAHVLGLVQHAADAFRGQDARLVTPALFAYAHFLEDELRLEEALDVLGTLLRIAGADLAPSDAIAAYLRRGRVNRKLNLFDQADAAYDVARELADVAGDVHSALLSRVGRAISTQARGNLAESERLFRALSTDARALGERDIEARAHHALGTTLLLRGQLGEAIGNVWRGVELYEDAASQVRALGDLGTMLLAVGEVAAAERALSAVVQRGQGMQDVVSNAMIELMHCASYRRDRLSFERWRGQTAARVRMMPPNILVDYYLKAGIGHARFRRFRQADELMDRALDTARQSSLHEFVFRIERVKTGLRDCELACSAMPVAEPGPQSDAVREVAASLALLEG